MSENKYEEYLQDAKRLYWEKLDTMKACTAEIVKICEQALNAEAIQHPHIKHRIKEWESAAGTLARRQEERIARQHLKDVVKRKGWEWKDWCQITGQEQHEQEIGHFQDGKEMLRALHDFGGIRISLYFPGDVERVAMLLSSRLHVVSTKRKDQSSDVAQTLEKCVKMLHQPEANIYRDGGRAAHLIKGKFPGYLATHFIVKLKPEDLPHPESVWREISVEIQVGTLIMHVWSEIGHDMIYKKLQGQEISRDEEEMLDLINGIVVTGEGALRQLEACTSRRINKRAEDKTAFASNYHELATWITRYYDEIQTPLAPGSWKCLPQIFDILEAAKVHRHVQVEMLLSKISTDVITRETIPLKMLECIIYDSRLATPPPADYNSSNMLSPSARFWALHFVHGLNMAIFLGVEDLFLCEIEKFDVLKPLLVQILDIVHPDHPQCKSVIDAATISHFCSKILEHTYEDPWINIAVRLSRTIDVSAIMEPNEPGYTVPRVSGLICRILPMARAPFPQHLILLDSLMILEFVDYYVNLRAPKLSIEFWDELQRVSSISASVSQATMEKRFWIPIPCEAHKQQSWKLLRTSATEPVALSWQIVDSRPQVEMAEDYWRVPIANPVQPAGNLHNSTHDYVLELLYRLHGDGDLYRLNEGYRLVMKHSIQIQQNVHFMDEEVAEEVYENVNEEEKARLKFSLPLMRSSNVQDRNKIRVWEWERLPMGSF